METLTRTFEYQQLVTSSEDTVEQEDVEALAASEKITLLDSIPHLCEKRIIELDRISSIIKKSGNFKKRLAEESKQLNMSQ